ncbi:MAG: SGNH/GDSL hydrolase family protein [Planctomycetota bacterium]
MSGASDPRTERVWHDLLDLTLEGRAFPPDQLIHPYDRLPASAQPLVTTPVWDLSHESTGIRCRFLTDSPELHARWSLRSSTPVNNHVPHTGKSGLDLYGRDDHNAWRWAGFVYATEPTGPTHQHQSTLYQHAHLPTPREFCLYLPYRGSTDRVELGIPATHQLTPAPPDPRPPLIFYGTSILHGSAASRPGMTYPAISARRLDYPFHNFGFAGNGPLHLEVAQLLAPLPAAAFVLAGCENMTPPDVAERAEPFVNILREHHPTTPIVLLENLPIAHAWFQPKRHDLQASNNANLRAAFDNLTAQGDTHLHYLTARQLMGSDDEATIDSAHPTDLGFFRIADALTPLLQSLLTEPAR